MTVFSLGQVSDLENGARVINESHFTSVVVGNPNAITLGSERESNFDEAISYLGVTGIRWPGGSEAERSFDWRSDASVTHALDVSDLRVALDYCANNDLSFSFTFPTAEFLNMLGTEIDNSRANIVKFINELLDYADQRDVVVDSIKIGNEYDLNGLSAEEYGRIASHLSAIVGETIHEYESIGDTWSRPDLVIESGRIWLQEAQSDLFFGDRDHNGIMDAQEIMDAFNTIEAGYVDAVDIHSMTLFLSSYEDYFGEGAYSNASLNTVYSSLNSFWNETFQDVELHTLAWQYPWRRDVDGPNGPGGVEDHGGSALANASLGFMHYYEMSLGGVGYAASWLASGWGGASPTLYHNEPRAGGEIFRLMQENLNGLRAIEFEHDPTVFQNSTDVEDIVFRAFEQPGNVVLYIGNLEMGAQTITIDDVHMFLSGVDGFDNLSSLTDFSQLQILGTRLGVEGDPNDYKSIAEIELLNLEDLLNTTNPNRSLSFDLAAYEIMQLSFTFSDKSMMETFGTEHNDILRGGVGDNSLSGGKGDDWLMGANGHDKLYGGPGDDNLRGDGGDDTLYGGLGNDNLRGADGNDLLSGGVGFDVLFGGSNDDKIYGGSNDDTLFGENGNDKLFGGNGNDYLHGGYGNDNLRGDDGNDTLYGENANDNLRGGTGMDWLLGGIGVDVLYGDKDDDYLRGDNDNDTLYGGDGNDDARGGSGNDWVHGGGGHDRVYGNSGHDNLRGDDGNDYMYGENGNDHMAGATGNDTMYGASGADRMYGGTGLDLMDGGVGNDTLYGQNDNDQIYGREGNDYINGGRGSDYLYGSEGDDTIIGDDGNDNMYGHADNDFLAGEAGDDNMTGGDGTDRLYGGTGGDSMYGDAGDDYMSGQNDDDIMNGGTGNDTLFGGMGNDRLCSFDGNDELTGGNGYDTFAFNSGTDNTVVHDFQDGTDIIEIEAIGINSIGDLTINYSDGNAMITYGTSLILLEDISPILGASDFLLTPF